MGRGQRSSATIGKSNLYHGENRWTVSPQFIDLFDVPEVLRPYLPDYREIRNCCKQILGLRPDKF